MLKLSRIGAVLALALLPAWGSASTVQARPAKWPVYPSLFFASDICSVSNNYVVCRPGGLMQSQINSGYECNEVDVVETGYGSGPINLTMSVDDQSQSQTISIDGNGTYFIQFPGFLVNNLVSLEFSMPDGASFGLPTIYSTPCPVATKTPTPAPTSTPNPSDTPTPVPNTNTPGPSPTITAIPTHTPLPSGHATFTPTGTAVPPTGTAAPTATPVGLRDCGLLLNCDLLPVADGTPVRNPYYWSPLTTSGFTDNTSTNWCGYSSATPLDPAGSKGVQCYIDQGMYQAFVAPVDGMLCILAQNNFGGSQLSIYFNTIASMSGAVKQSGPGLPPYANCSFASYAVSRGSMYYVLIGTLDGVNNGTGYLDKLLIVSPGGTPVPSLTPSATPVPGSPSPGPATNTPLPNPFGTASPIPSDTPCPGGCAVAALTTVPGFSTVVTIDTSPFSPLTHLSLGRSPCTPFGYVQIPYPVITGTPVMGQPLQFAWTVPVTHTWDDTHIITNTAIQPCAMVGEISPYVWDFTYWGSGFGLFVVFTLWLIGWIGRLSGDHTIDG